MQGGESLACQIPVWKLEYPPDIHISPKNKNTNTDRQLHKNCVTRTYLNKRHSKPAHNDLAIWTGLYCRRTWSIPPARRSSVIGDRAPSVLPDRRWWEKRGGRWHFCRRGSRLPTRRRQQHAGSMGSVRDIGGGFTIKGRVWTGKVVMHQL